MLTSDLLKSNKGLETLTPEQITIIETLSKTDEGIVIAKKIKEIHSQYDADILEVTGKKKPDGIKTYAHLKTVLGEYAKVNVDDFNTKITTLEKERDDLAAKVKANSGADAKALEQKLADANSLIDTLKADATKAETDYKSNLEAEQKKTIGLELNNAFDSYVIENKVKFLPTLPEAILKETLSRRKETLLGSLTADLIDDGSGGKVRVFRDKEGEIMRNKENGLQPFTAGELYGGAIQDLIEKGKDQKGAGTKAGGGTGGAGGGSLADLSGARSQVAADKVIVSHILKNEGIAKTDPRFAERQSALRTEHKVADLPMRDSE